MSLSESSSTPTRQQSKEEKGEQNSITTQIISHKEIESFFESFFVKLLSD